MGTQNTVVQPDKSKQTPSSTPEASGSFLNDNWKDLAFMVNDIAQATKTTLSKAQGNNLAKTRVFLPLGASMRVNTSILIFASKVGQPLAKAAPWVAGSGIVVDVVSNQRVDVGNIYLVAITGFSLIPGAGLIVGGGALAAEGVSYYLTGRSVSDNINLQFNGGVVYSWK